MRLFLATFAFTLSGALFAPIGSGSPESVTLDILSESNSTFKTVKCELDDAPSMVFAPALGYKLDKVVAGDSLLFDGKDAVHVALLNVHLKNGLPESAFLLLQPESGEQSSKNLVLKDSTGNPADAKWEEVNAKDFGEAVKKVRTVPQSAKTFTLDIGKNDDRWAALELQNLNTLVLIPHTGFHANKVTRGDYLFWEGKPGERCITAFLVDDRQLHLMLKYKQEKEWVLTFTYDGGTWHD